MECDGGSHTDEFAEEEGQSDADGSQERGAVLLDSQHQDDEDELCGEEHFNEETLGSVRVATEECVNRHCTREECVDDTSCCEGSKELSWDDEEGTDDGETATDHESERDLLTKVS